jgi:sulfur carrier protein
VEITLNGEIRQVPDGATIAQLIEELGLGRFPYAVELNQRLAPRPEHGTTVLQPGDAVEVVTFVGGG